MGNKEQQWEQIDLDGRNVPVTQKKLELLSPRDIVSSFILQTRAAIEAGKPMPGFNLDHEQTSIFYELMASRREELERWKQRWQAEESQE